jgi:hypothetical protein
MEREKIIFLRNFFLRAFVVGIVIALLYWIATIALSDSSLVMWMLHLFNADRKDLPICAIGCTLLLRFRPLLADRVIARCKLTMSAATCDKSLLSW